MSWRFDKLVTLAGMDNTQIDGPAFVSNICFLPNLGQGLSEVVFFFNF